MKRLIAGAFLLLAAACQSFSAQPIIVTETSSPIAINVLPSATPSVVASATSLASPTSPPPTSIPPTPIPATLAPFPVSPENLDPSPIPPNAGFPASAPVPLALSEHDHFYFSRPVLNAELDRLIPSNRYGSIQIGTKNDAHGGVDMVMDIGTPLVAAAPGTVIFTGVGLFDGKGRANDPYGVAIVIAHDFGFDGEHLYTAYAHLSQTYVDVGQHVERGEVIGISGNTGLTTGPHLHFEVRSGTNSALKTRNPELWIAPPEGWGVLAGRITDAEDKVVLNIPVQVTSVKTGQHWESNSYATENELTQDAYYQENFVLGDLPAGRYKIQITYLYTWFTAEVEIKPGAVTYFNFHGYNGFNFELPEEPSLDFVPE